MEHAETYYRHADGSPTREAVNCEIALRLIRAKFGTRPIDDITYQGILDARDELIAGGLNRGTINQRVGIWRRFFAWALEARLCLPQTKSEVLAVGNLKRGRSEATDGDPVQPVKHLTVKRTLPFLPPNLQAMIRVQELCGARPAEMCAMRPCDIERRREWVYRPASHSRYAIPSLSFCTLSNAYAPQCQLFCKKCNYLLALTITKAVCCRPCHNYSNKLT